MLRYVRSYNNIVCFFLGQEKPTSDNSKQGLVPGFIKLHIFQHPRTTLRDTGKLVGSRKNIRTKSGFNFMSVKQN